ncbi:MAGUK p55 subfamily member 7-like isoform X1 [Mytilus californianus]|uniref:MAGUK p55 subfamily member 7-like isoform X1 n=2 Tax=Mytilus californianus TaxID=6549 RepID=UPI00224528C7|nr:MAGUK p55 subfamily member 7-like isoform X1 [Mytilus californianus]
MNLPLKSRLLNDPDTQELIQCLPQIQTQLCQSQQDAVFLRKFFRGRDIQVIMKLYRRLCLVTAQRLRPVTKSSVALAANTYCVLRHYREQAEADELLNLLSKPHMQALLYSHDNIALKEYEPDISSLAGTPDKEEETIKLVQLVKSNEPLGITLQLNDVTGGIEIARILHGGAAHRSGLINVGDEVKEINGITFHGKDPKDMTEILSELQGAVSMKLGTRTRLAKDQRSSSTKVRALFDYNPFDDQMIPCPHAGLSFQKGDILYIVSQEDPLWWQAKKAGETRAGLIPARLLQERREILKNAENVEEESNRRGARSISPCRISPKSVRSRRVRKMMYHAVLNSDFDLGEIPTYEDVELLPPNSKNKRPLVLIGAPKVGRNELKRRLMVSNPGHFEDVVPFTSRPKKPTELDGVEYHFITRDEMESALVAHRFIEHGEFKGNLYGTRKDSILSVINSGKVCVLTPNSQALRFLRTAEIKPYVIFIKSPPFQQIQRTRQRHNAVFVFEGNARPFMSSDFDDIVQTSMKLEQKYCHLFDSVIINENLTKAASELITIAKLAETKSHWVPVSWV